MKSPKDSMVLCRIRSGPRCCCVAFLAQFLSLVQDLAWSSACVYFELMDGAPYNVRKVCISPHRRTGFSSVGLEITGSSSGWT